MVSSAVSSWLVLQVRNGDSYPVSATEQTYDRKILFGGRHFCREKFSSRNFTEEGKMEY
jgi:hypothetical protein